ncbi:MAG: DUF4156 domain-containing protein [Burkholderiales bacterium]|nr:DUF4156 domain-containing protein [Nitrosomonas sp.]MCP5275660.1 DUF4156 domain-containing protein [Burkholderiales bacterium]
MYQITKSRLLITIAVLAMLSVSHSAIAETPASKSTESILLMIGKEQDLAGCKLLGSVTGASQDSDNDLTYPERLIIARDNLRAETAKLGGNAVHVIRSNTTRFEIQGVDKKIVFLGNAYRCE